MMINVFGPRGFQQQILMAYNAQKRKKHNELGVCPQAAAEGKDRA